MNVKISRRKLMFSSVEGSIGSQSNRDMVYKTQGRFDHEFFKLYDFTLAEMKALKGNSEVVVYDTIKKSIKKYKRLVHYYFFFVIDQLNREPKFREAAESLMPELNQFIAVFELEKIPGMLSKSAKLPGHITHYYNYINDWLDAYKPITVYQQSKVISKKSPKSSSILQESMHINFID